MKTYLKEGISKLWTVRAHATGVLGIANLLLAGGNIWMMITGVLLIVLQAMDYLE